MLFLFRCSSNVSALFITKQKEFAFGQFAGTECLYLKQRIQCFGSAEFAISKVV